MIRVLFFDNYNACVYETPVFTAQFGRALDKSSPWSASVPLTRTLYDLLSNEVYAELWDGKTYCIGGKVQNIPVKFDADTVIEIKGREELDVLYDAAANSALYINNKSFLLQLFTILESCGARFGRYEDIDRLRLITQDVRTEKQGITLFNTLLKLEPKLKYRFGGFDVDGQMMVDVSEFDDTFRYQVLPASPGQQTNAIVIQDTQTVDDYTKHIYALEAIGGDMTDNVGVKRPVRLGDLANFTTLRFDLNYPVYEEQAEVKYTIVPTAEGAVGGRVTCWPSGATIGAATIGETSGAGTANRWQTFIFHPFPGTLTECSFWLVAVTASLISNQSVNPFLWEVKEVDESNVLDIPLRPNLASGIIPEGTWGANQRVRLTFPTGITASVGKRLALRVGFGTMPATSAQAQVRLIVANSSKSFRGDFSALADSALNTSQNSQPVFEAVTVGTHVGRRATEYQTKFVPQKESGNAPLVDIQATALALYEWGVLQFINTVIDRHDLITTLAGFRLDWKPGDVIYVLSQVQMLEGNLSAWETRTIETLEYTFSDQISKTVVKFLPNVPIDENDNVIIALFDKQKEKKTTPEGRIIEPQWAWELTELPSMIQFKVPDTTLSDGTPAVTVTFTLTPAPAGKFETQLIGTPYGVHSNTAVPIVVEVVSKSATSVVCSVAIRDVGWSLYDEAVIYCHQVWR